jgi:alpha-L-arabinofuranosidase
VNRRAFLKAGASAAVGALARPRPVFAVDTEMLLSPGEPGAVISPEIYGHFIEHLGGVIYDGV